MDSIPGLGTSTCHGVVKKKKKKKKKRKEKIEKLGGFIAQSISLPKI